MDLAWVRHDKSWRYGVSGHPPKPLRGIALITKGILSPDVIPAQAGDEVRGAIQS